MQLHTEVDVHVDKVVLGGGLLEDQLHQRGHAAVGPRRASNQLNDAIGESVKLFHCQLVQRQAQLAHKVLVLCHGLIQPGLLCSSSLQLCSPGRLARLQGLLLLASWPPAPGVAAPLRPQLAALPQFPAPLAGGSLRGAAPRPLSLALLSPGPFLLPARHRPRDPGRGLRAPAWLLACADPRGPAEHSPARSQEKLYRVARR
mmetsp:Transcript_109511/g.353416  ORF Transcript_109511/g.353416 Transcript_109511/m.353416 type:complete len:202 (-) Transcript_109511:1472-2077(-)